MDQGSDVYACVLEITAPRDGSAQRLIDDAQRAFRDGTVAAGDPGADRG